MRNCLVFSIPGIVHADHLDYPVSIILRGLFDVSFFDVNVLLIISVCITLYCRIAAGGVTAMNQRFWLRETAIFVVENANLSSTLL